jgi:hypothetical protein
MQTCIIISKFFSEIKFLKVQIFLQSLDIITTWFFSEQDLKMFQNINVSHSMKNFEIKATHHVFMLHSSIYFLKKLCKIYMKPHIECINNI